MNTEQSEPPKSCPRHRSGRRFGLLTFAALELWMWFGMAVLDYERGSLFPFSTAGWFIISQIFAIPLFVCVVWVTELLFARWPWVIGVLVAGSMSTLLGMTIHDALPRQKLNWLIGPNLVRHGEIENMQVTDSFGDGDTYQGILLIGPEFLKALQSDPSFELIKPDPDRNIHPDKAGTIYQSNRAKLRVAPDGRKCLFESQFEHTPAKPRKPRD